VAVCLLNARLHVTAKREQELVKQIQSSSSLCSRNSTGHSASFVLTRQKTRGTWGGEMGGKVSLTSLCCVTATLYGVCSSGRVKSVAEDVGNLAGCRDIHC
jgi:hypothetical protein